MDSDQINVFTDSFNFEKKCIRIPVFLMYSMYSDSGVQKLKVFGFGNISTSANHQNFCTHAT